jgi:amino-acid N-acetyltransferase
VENSPKFTQQPGPDLVNTAISGPLHVALVKIRAPQNMDDEALNGIGLTLSQLGKLGLISTVVVDCEDPTEYNTKPGSNRWRDLAMEQANRIAEAIDAHGKPGSRQINNVIGFSENEEHTYSSAACLRGRTHVTYRNLLMTPLRRGVIPVIAAIGYTDETHRAVPVRADDVVLALTREFAGLKAAVHPDEHHEAIAEKLKALRSEVSLDRLIILDPLGGIPTTDRPNGYHVFLNLEQEFGPVKQDLLSQSRLPNSIAEKATPALGGVTDIGRGNPFSRFVELEFGSPAKVPKETESSMEPRTIAPDNLIHMSNLELTRRVLSMLPPSSSALLTTPEEAANSGRQAGPAFQSIGVGTRRQRNPLIHNLLTDKPVFSSSLPSRRLTQSISSAVPTINSVARIHPTTFAKRGMSVTIFPNPKDQPWSPCLPGKAPLTLEDTRVDLSRLVHLINDSFNRTLDVEAYLKRVNDRIAGVIIAGEYEGGALLTWEMPPGVVDDGSEESRLRMVPYLDKFAVLKRAQGSGGVADILFKTMVRDCFPEGVCWRSRRDNPVNKWYFERSRGTWKLPNTNWTMFWTTPDLSKNQQKFSDYEGVCESIVPSWSDNKPVMD